MVVYEFYTDVGMNGSRLIGILPERRKDLARITEGSIMNWVKKVMGDGADLGKVRLVRVTLEQNQGMVCHMILEFPLSSMNFLLPT